MIDRTWQEWDKFLEDKTLEFGLTKAQTSVFATRFARENWQKKIEDVWQFSSVVSRWILMVLGSTVLGGYGWDRGD